MGLAIPFLGGGYPQTFLLADLTVDGLEPDTVHAFLTGSGPLFFSHSPARPVAPHNHAHAYPVHSAEPPVTAGQGTASGTFLANWILSRFG